MTREEYEEWCRQLWRCSSSGGKVSWPTFALAQAAVGLMEGPNPGVYRHKPPDGCGLFHLTRDLQERLSRGQRQRRNQPETARLAQARQRRARRERDRQKRKGMR